tara:strand:- start:1583 stop:2437 length:855 start_codon:yes stop_codon:yes gene_type:complete
MIEWVAEQFAGADLYYGHGTDNPWDEAVALVLTLANIVDDQAMLAEALGADIEEQIRALAEQRIRERVPLPYLLGECWYVGYPFWVDPAVIVPRSPLGHVLADGLQPWRTAPVCRVLDLCAGSGSIGIIAALCYPEAEVVMVDIDPAAVALCERNIQRHELTERVRVVQADAARYLAEQDSQWDLIVTNPPYVDAADMATLPAEYRHEPKLALAAADDGLAVINAVLQALPGRLADGGILLGEVGGSAAALGRCHAQLPFIWLALPDGGEGVFVLEAQAVSAPV